MIINITLVTFASILTYLRYKLGVQLCDNCGTIYPATVKKCPKCKR